MVLAEPSSSSRTLTPQSSAAQLGSSGRGNQSKTGPVVGNLILPGRPDIWMRSHNSMKDSAPLLSKVLETHAWKDGRVACGVASMRGFRAQMEDCMCILRPLSDSSQQKFRFCGVFDGHAQSRRVAEALEENLPRKIGEQKQKAWMTKAGIEKACLEVDKEILRSAYSDAGSTAIFCIMRSERDHLSLSVGGVGDSQAMIVHSDFSKPPSVPLGNNIHRPQMLATESDRIQRAGGFIANNRVDGELAVSRAFGDAKYKRNIALSMHEQKVVAIPAVAENILLAPGDVLVMGCDGLYDSMNPSQIDTFVRSTLISVMVKRKKFFHPVPPSLWNLAECLSEVAGLLVDEALLRGSRDNISAMLVQISAKENDILPWSDKFSRLYVPPIIFLPLNPALMMTIRDELRTFCLDEDLTLSQVERVTDVPTHGFSPSLTRADLLSVLQGALSRQWDHKDTWVRLGDFEIPDHKFPKKRRVGRSDSLITGQKPLNPWQRFLQSFVCFSVGATEDSKHHPNNGGERKHRLSASAGAFSKISSVHASSIHGTGFVVSSINSIPVTSRQTSAAEEDELEVTEHVHIHSSTN